MWEYKVEVYNQDNRELAAFLNEQGQDGWQLTTFVPTSWVNAQNQTMQEQIRTAETLAVFKRQRT